MRFLQNHKLTWLVAYTDEAQVADDHIYPIIEKEKWYFLNLYFTIFKNTKKSEILLFYKEILLLDTRKVLVVHENQYYGIFWKILYIFANCLEIPLIKYY